MKTRLNLLAAASVCTVFLVASIAVGAGETSVKLAVTETSEQTAAAAAALHGPPRELRMAQCQSGRDDCQTRPQSECGPGLDACLTQGQADCQNRPPAANDPGPNTTGIDKALQNPHLTPETRARLEKLRAAMGHARNMPCLQRTIDRCRAAHC